MAWTDTGGNLKGPKGDKGDKGDTGEGSKWLTGTAVPANSLGADGDYYLKTDTGQVYGPKAGGKWGAVAFTLKGEDGDTGVVSATAPLALSAEKVLSIAVGTAANTVAAGNHLHDNFYLRKNADTAMAANKYLSVNPPTNDGHAATKKYVDDRLATFAGGVTLVGAYDPEDDKITVLATQTAPLNLYTLGGKIPAAKPEMKGHYFLVTTGGVIDTPLKAPVDADSGDWLVCTGVAWVHVPIADAYRQVFYQDTQPAGIDFQPGNIWVKSSTGQIYVKKDKTTVVEVKAEPTAHTHTIGNVTGLQAALNGKAALGNVAGKPLAAAAAAGTATTAAKSDHVHPLPTLAALGAAPANHDHDEYDEVKVATKAPTDNTSELWVHSTTGAVKYKSGGSWKDILTGNGPQGSRGTGWHVGTGAPGTIAGSIVGDLYLDTNTGNVYRLD
jgi:hypothetical protein